MNPGESAVVGPPVPLPEGFLAVDNRNWESLPQKEQDEYYLFFRLWHELWKEFEVQIDAAEPLLKHQEQDFDRQVSKDTWDTANGFRSLRITKFDTQDVLVPIMLPKIVQISLTDLDEVSETRKNKTFFAEQFSGQLWQLEVETRIDEAGQSSYLESLRAELEDADEFTRLTGVNRGNIFDLIECLEVLKSLATLPRTESEK